MIDETNRLPATVLSGFIGADKKLDGAGKARD